MLSSVFSLLISLLFSYKEWLVTLFLGWITLKIARFYAKVYRYPRGPFPWPVVGNLLRFRGVKRNPFFAIDDLAKTYGRVFTFWMGATPFICVTDVNLIKEAFNSKGNEFLGRPMNTVRRLITDNDKFYDVVFSDHLPAWASLRKVAHSAVRKYASSEQLAVLVSDVVDEMISDIKSDEGIGKPFDPVNYIYFAMLNIIATTAFGKRFKKTDTEMLFIKNNIESFRQQQDTLGKTQLPIVKYFYQKKLQEMTKMFQSVVDFTQSKYTQRTKDFQEGVVRDFSDALISAKNEAVKESKETAPHLNDGNLARVLFDLFFAGSDTTNYTLRWIMLFMAKHPEMQKKMRQEIAEQIGDRMPVQEDKLKLHYVMAFINECLRHRGIVNLGVPHRVLANGQIGNHVIPYDDNILVIGMLWSVNHDPNYWKDPDTFEPKRFLDKKIGELITDKRKLPAFVTFGVGKRVCPGERLAIEDLFLITVRMLQQTSGLMFELPDGPDSVSDEPDAGTMSLIAPQPFQLVIR